MAIQALTVSWTLAILHPLFEGSNDSDMKCFQKVSKQFGVKQNWKPLERLKALLWKPFIFLFLQTILHIFITGSHGFIRTQVRSLSSLYVSFAGTSNKANPPNHSWSAFGCSRGSLNPWAFEQIFRWGWWQSLKWWCAMLCMGLKWPVTVNLLFSDFFWIWSTFQDLHILILSL